MIKLSVGDCEKINIRFEGDAGTPAFIMAGNRTFFETIFAQRNKYIRSRGEVERLENARQILRTEREMDQMALRAQRDALIRESDAFVRQRDEAWRACEQARADTERLRKSLPMVCDASPRHLYSAAYQDCPVCAQILKIKESGNVMIQAANREITRLKALLSEMKTNADATADASDMLRAQKCPNCGDRLRDHTCPEAVSNMMNAHLLERLWRPIATAPKDCEVLLLTDETCRRVVIGNWYANDGIWFDRETTRLKPLYWMPLPTGLS